MPSRYDDNSVGHGGRRSGEPHRYLGVSNVCAVESDLSILVSQVCAKANVVGDRMIVRRDPRDRRNRFEQVDLIASAPRGCLPRSIGLPGQDQLIRHHPYSVG